MHSLQILDDSNELGIVLGETLAAFFNSNTHNYKYKFLGSLGIKSHLVRLDNLLGKNKQATVLIFWVAELIDDLTICSEKFLDFTLILNFDVHIG